MMQNKISNILYQAHHQLWMCKHLTNHHTFLAALLLSDINKATRDTEAEGGFLIKYYYVEFANLS